jgi:thioredoxin 1
MGYTAEYTPQEPTRTEVDAIAGPMLVEFGAPWCPHCIAVQETLADLLKQFPDVSHIKIYDGKGKPLGRSFRVKLWPNLVFIRDGKVIRQLARPGEAEILDAFKAFTAIVPTPGCGSP